MNKLLYADPKYNQLFRYQLQTFDNDRYTFYENKVYKSIYYMLNSKPIECIEYEP
jgi:hypothetical protein